MTAFTARGTLRLLTALAHEFAQDGQLADGYSCLIRGLHAAEVAVRQGQPWAVELLLDYRQALHDYIARYGVPLE